jgi:predicted Zn-dependent protease
MAVLLGFILLGFGIGLVVLSYGPKAYSGWRESRLIKRATTMLQEGNLQEASRAANDALAIRPDSVAAFHILAETTEKQNLADTVTWRAQIARLEPTLENHLNVASAALRFGQLDTARRALGLVAPADRDKAAYHVVAGWLARAQGNEAEVEQHFAAAVQKEPGNDLYQFNLAVLQISSPLPEKSDNARTQLQRLSKIAGFRTGSVRALLGDAIHRGDFQVAEALAQDLQMSQQVTFSDYLVCLDLYRKRDEKKFTALLDKVKPVAQRNPGDLGLLLDWMNRNGLAAEVLKWTDKLPPTQTTSPPAAISVADALTETKNWSRLKRWTRADSWGDADYLRLAYQAYGARQVKQATADAEFESLWQSAERAATGQPDRELNLARLATRWNLPVEAERLWMRVAKNTGTRREALEALLLIYRGRQDYDKIYSTAQALHETSPDEVPLAANYARLGLLLDKNVREAHRVAKELYDKAPEDPLCAVTYALSMYIAGRTAEGVEILKKLPPEQLREPHAAAYTAVLLLDDNQPQPAKEFIDIAKAGPIFPSEKRLLEDAIAKAAASPTLLPSPAAAASVGAPEPAATPPIPPL